VAGGPRASETGRGPGFLNGTPALVRIGALDGGDAQLPGANPDDRVDRRDPHLAVPDLAVRAASAMIVSSDSASESSQRISSLTLRMKSTVMASPRYISRWPRWRAYPETSETVIPLTP
jgi:hypothetical protein